MSYVDRIEPRRASELLRKWFVTRGADSVEFHELLNPEVDPNESYRVAYEASFTPNRLDRARTEVWVTDDGLVAFGFEQRTRVERRMGKGEGHEWFAAGIEPVAMSDGQLLSLLGLSADGRIGLRVMTVPLVGIVSLRAFVPAGTKERSGLWSSSFRWLSEGSGSLWPFTELLTYEAW